MNEKLNGIDSSLQPDNKDYCLLLNDTVEIKVMTSSGCVVIIVREFCNEFDFNENYAPHNIAMINELQEKKKIKKFTMTCTSILDPIEEAQEKELVNEYNAKYEAYLNAKNAGKLFDISENYGENKTQYTKQYADDFDLSHLFGPSEELNHSGINEAQVDNIGLGQLFDEDTVQQYISQKKVEITTSNELNEVDVLENDILSRLFEISEPVETFKVCQSYESESKLTSLFSMAGIIDILALFHLVKGHPFRHVPQKDFTRNQILKIIAAEMRVIGFNFRNEDLNDMIFHELNLYGPELKKFLKMAFPYLKCDSILKLQDNILQKADNLALADFNIECVENAARKNRKALLPITGFLSKRDYYFCLYWAILSNQKIILEFFNSDKYHKVIEVDNFDEIVPRSVYARQWQSGTGKFRYLNKDYIYEKHYKVTTVTLVLGKINSNPYISTFYPNYWDRVPKK